MIMVSLLVSLIISSPRGTLQQAVLYKVALVEDARAFGVLLQMLK